MKFVYSTFGVFWGEWVSWKKNVKMTFCVAMSLDLSPKVLDGLSWRS